ncbi:MAG TPA: cation:proton antiporter [Candidatus Limnocylindrales bacterium]|nr:cation:proton antiporter [Candidatus Limnocylindrales bacterium]
MPGLLLTLPDNAQIPMAMLLVFASAKLLSEIFERLGQPGIAGEILAGVLIGPHVLGWLAPNQALQLLSGLGVMFLLFRVGLHVKSSDLMKLGGTAVSVAVAGVIVPFLMGWGISALWGEPHIEAIFTGAAMVATSVGITAEVLASRGLLDTAAARVILGAAVVDDVLGLIVLAMVSGLAANSVNYLDLALTAGLAIAFTLFVAWFGSRTVRRVMPRVQAKLVLAEREFALAMTLLFALSLLAVFAGIAAIVGAFLAGMALSESVDARVVDLTNGVTELLVPFFLVGIGMRLDPRALSGSSALLLGGAILLAAIVSKFIGCGLGALHMGRRDALRVAVGMIPRGEVGIVVAQIGLTLGVMSQKTYGIIVFMSVATTLVAPPLLKLVFPRGGVAAQQTVHLG